MSIFVWQVIAIGVIAITLVGYFAIGRGRTQGASSRFGPRYDRTVGVLLLATSGTNQSHADSSSENMGQG